MKTAKVLKRLETEGYAIIQKDNREGFERWIAVRKLRRNIEFRGAIEVDSFTVGLRTFHSLSSAMKASGSL